jgi:SprT protein
MNTRSSSINSGLYYQEAQVWLATNPKIRVCIQNHVENLLDLASLAFKAPLAVIDIKYDLRGTMAGCASVHEIRLNAVLLKENLKDFLRHTIPHEVAHSAVLQRWPQAKPHGSQWQSLMIVFGCPPIRCHHYDTRHVQRRQITRYSYACLCGIRTLTAIRHRRVLQGTRYQCRHCHQYLKSI